MTRLRSWLVVAMVPLFSGSDGRLACLFCAVFVGAAKEERFLRAMRGVAWWMVGVLDAGCAVLYPWQVRKPRGVGRKNCRNICFQEEVTGPFSGRPPCI